MKLLARWKTLYRQFISGGTRPSGLLLNFGSAWAFYFATFFVHKGSDGGAVQPEIFAFFRYLSGFVLFGGLFFWYGRTGPRPPAKFLIFRSVMNVSAVLCFYYAVSRGAAGKANVFNMTYPAFVILFAGPVLGEFPSRRTMLLAGLSVLGIALNFYEPMQNTGGLAVADLWGLASGILAALAVIALRGAALVADAREILFWMFGLGTVVLLVFRWNLLFSIPGHAVFYIAASSLLGVLGQWLLTESYRGLPATTGSIVSSTRIPIALIVGFCCLNEPFSVLSWSGAALIFTSNLLLAFTSSHEKHVVVRSRE